MDKKICMLITKPPHTTEGCRRVCGLSKRAREKKVKVSIYLIGDGVLFAKKNLEGNVLVPPDDYIDIKANIKDLLARGITPDKLEFGVEAVDNIEDMFIRDTMENSKLVVTW